MIGSRPWLCYWIIHSIALLGDCLDDKLENDFIDFLSRCQVSSGLKLLCSNLMFAFTNFVLGINETIIISWHVTFRNPCASSWRLEISKFRQRLQWQKVAFTICWLDALLFQLNSSTSKFHIFTFRGKDCTFW